MAYICFNIRFYKLLIIFGILFKPGQSTRVNYRYFFNLSGYYYYNAYGILVKKAENPKSRVIFLYCDYGFLSRLAVLVTSLNDLANDVFPLSI